LIYGTSQSISGTDTEKVPVYPTQFATLETEQLQLETGSTKATATVAFSLLLTPYGGRIYI
jgi:hypothetical protein